MRTFTEFRHREAAFLVSTAAFDEVRQEIRRCRRLLGEYIARNPLFMTSLDPLPELIADPPEIARRMHTASLATGVGPMAAVAGATAQLAVEAARRAGCDDTIVNNGGDLFLHLKQDALVGLYGGDHSLAGRLAFRIMPETTPLALCSSSSKMGHSRSFGRCELATVCAADGALADAAATLAGNLADNPEQAGGVAEGIAGIAGVTGVLILIGETVAMAGRLPPLVAVGNDAAGRQVLRHPLHLP